MSRATNALSSKVQAPVASGEYLEILPFSRDREVFLLKNPAGEQPVNVVIGGDTPTDDTRAFTLEIGSSIDFFRAPMGPVWIKTAVESTSDMEMIAD